MEARISIHALLAESDVINGLEGRKHGKFLSTLSLRRATLVCSKLRQLADISIHALLAESDRYRAARRAEPGIFLSTLSLRRATTVIIPTQIS